MASRTPSPSRAPSPLESPDLPLASRSLKRRRAPSPSPGPVLPVEDSGKEKTRRVNPYRLAERLGEDLVAELDSFIYPGAKMPSYSERKVIQDKFLVDRRHIYDYLHSRGLRVAKEDRHLNLHRNRMNTGPRPQTKKPRPLPPARPRSPKAKKVKQSQPKRSEIAITGDSQLCEDSSANAVKLEDLPMERYVPAQQSSTFLEHQTPFVPGHRFTDHETEHKPQQITTLSPASIKERFLWEPRPLSPQDPPLTLDNTWSEEESYPSYTWDPAFTDELMAGWLDLDGISEPADAAASTQDDPLILESPVDSVYDLINSSLTSTGPQESSGSYMSHMQDQSFEYQQYPGRPQPQRSPLPAVIPYQSSIAKITAHSPSAPIHPSTPSILSDKENGLILPAHLANSYYYSAPRAMDSPTQHISRQPNHTVLPVAQPVGLPARASYWHLAQTYGHSHALQAYSAGLQRPVLNPNAYNFGAQLHVGAASSSGS